jgi:hypothetical protein
VRSANLPKQRPGNNSNGGLCENRTVALVAAAMRYTGKPSPLPNVLRAQQSHGRHFADDLYAHFMLESAK